MNILFPIELQATGTPDVESFSSYIYRSAYEHGVSVGVFSKYIQRVSSKTNNECSNYSLKFQTEDLIRPGKTTRALIKQLERMTGKQLKEGILWFLSRNIGTCRREVEKGFRWCPECFKEMDKKGITPYFKLIWHLSGINACPIHRTRLVSECEYCGDKQTKLRRKYKPGQCNECGRPLSERKKKVKPDQILDSWMVNGLDIVQLFSDLSKYNDIEINMKKARDSLFYLYCHRHTDLIKTGIADLITMTQIHRMMTAYRSITVSVIRRICYAMGIPLFDLLSGNAERYHNHLFCLLEETYTPDFMRIQAKRKIDHKMIRDEILRLTTDAENPLSLKEMAEKVGVSVGYLDYRHPDIAKKLVDKHQKHVEKYMLQKREKAKAAALQYFMDKNYEDVYKSRKHAYKVLRERTGLPKFIIINAVQDVFSGRI